jgi:hypothetical protein
MAKPQKPLSIQDTIEVLTRLGDTASQVVLIGGQALNFWAERYAVREKSLAAEGPYASKDIDFCGTQEQLRVCARALNGRAEYQSSDARSLCIGIVHYLDSDADERELDFLSKPYGLETEPVFEMSFPATVRSADGREATIRIMHPLHCFMSRFANVADLEKYQNDQGLKQLRASILCLQTFLSEQLDEDNAKAVRKLNERIFRFCVDSEYPQKVFKRYGIEAFNAVPHADARLPEQFRKRRHAQMLAQVTSRRARPA